MPLELYIGFERALHFMIYIKRCFNKKNPNGFKLKQLKPKKLRSKKLNLNSIISWVLQI